MKKLITVILLWMVSVQILHAQANLPGSAASGAAKEEQELLGLSKTKWAWMSAKNVESPDALFHEKSVFVHMGGAGVRPGNLTSSGEAASGIKKQRSTRRR